MAQPNIESFISLTSHSLIYNKFKKHNAFVFNITDHNFIFHLISIRTQNSTKPLSLRRAIQIVFSPRKFMNSFCFLCIVFFYTFCIIILGIICQSIHFDRYKFKSMNDKLTSQHNRLSRIPIAYSEHQKNKHCNGTYLHVRSQ